MEKVELERQELLMIWLFFSGKEASTMEEYSELIWLRETLIRL
jgi:hypothetical protein